MGNIEEMRAQLEALSEQLNDFALQLLSEAIANGQTTRPDAEKKISQARRAVDKAIHHLSDISTD